jgi:hypothetical protein
VEQQQPPALYDQQNTGSDDDVSDSKEEESDEETLQKLNDGVQNLESELRRRQVPHIRPSLLIRGRP